MDLNLKAHILRTTLQVMGDGDDRKLVSNRRRYPGNFSYPVEACLSCSKVSTSSIRDSNGNLKLTKQRPT